VSPRTIGVEAKAPNELVPVNAKRHLTFSLATVRESMGVRVVVRVFERSWSCAGQPPALAAHSGGGLPAVVPAAAAAAASASRSAVRAAMRRRVRM
jgi:hypothetical protein